MICVHRTSTDAQARQDYQDLHASILFDRVQQVVFILVLVLVLVLMLILMLVLMLVLALLCMALVAQRSAGVGGKSSHHTTHA